MINLRLLIVSRVAWNSSTNFGNTYSSIFGGMKDVDIAHIYFGSGNPDMEIATSFFRVTEKDLLRRIIRKDCKCGQQVYCSQKNVILEKSHVQRLSFKPTLFYILRDILFETNVWKTADLSKFISDFNPDVIFAPLYGHIYMNRIERYIKQVANCPLVSFVSDDVYSFRQFSLSPMFWLYRLALRREIKKTVNEGSMLFTISELQRYEYSKAFNRECQLLYKGANFSIDRPMYIPNSPLIMCYTGNLSAGRWKTVALIAQAIKRINVTKECIIFNIYTTTPLTRKQRELIEVCDSVKIVGSVSGAVALVKQSESDILLHCESFQIRERLKVRLSFSTKIVDYFSRARCILAVGDRSVASIKYLSDNDAAICIDSKGDIYKELVNLVENDRLITEYAEKAWLCGCKHHDIGMIQSGLYDFLLGVVEGR